VRSYNGPGNGWDWAYGIAAPRFGNVYVTGYSYGSGTDYDYATIKYCQAVRGDVDGDGAINVGDVVRLVNFLYRSGHPPNPWVAGDFDCDGALNVGDVVWLVNYLFREGPSPPC
jgi:hypothetical protein